LSVLIPLLSGSPAPPGLSYAIHETLFKRGDRLLGSVQQLFAGYFWSFRHPVNMARLHGFYIGQDCANIRRGVHILGGTRAPAGRGMTALEAARSPIAPPSPSHLARAKAI
jgi:hypothetical protein